MIYLRALLFSVFSVVALFLLTKIIGRRQVSQLSLFDYINGITIGSIAAEIAICDDKNEFITGLIAMAVYAFATLGFALLSDKSIILRRFFEGVPIVLMENGRIYEKNFAKAKIDISEFLMRCRAEGYFDLCDIDTAVFEANGTLSVLAKAGKSPVKAEEMGIAPGRAGLNAAVIIDGRIMKKNLANIGYDAAFLRHKLKNMNVKISDVFYASCNAGGDVCVFERTNAYPKGKLE